MIMMEDYEDYDEYDESLDWDRGCVLGDECLHHDPKHSSDECFNLEMAQEYEREGMRETEEYKLGAAETHAATIAEVLAVVDDVESEMKAYFSKSYCADGFGEIRSRLAALSPTIPNENSDE